MTVVPLKPNALRLKQTSRAAIKVTQVSTRAHLPSPRVASAYLSGDPAAFSVFSEGPEGRSQNQHRARHDAKARAPLRCL